MYSDKTNVNILTALLVGHGITDAVVCPGSRNAPIVHNLAECTQIRCHPVTDERSAAFFALGLRQTTGRPVVVCVTSGSALLNVAPAVAEATYQRQGIIVVSADRPERWIDQLDGQTLPQPGALRGLVGCTVSLPEPHNDEERWHCNRLVNEALIEVKRYQGRSVHINVPITEPLFSFTTAELPHERVINIVEAEAGLAALDDVVRRMEKARRAMLVVGQMADSNVVDRAVRAIRNNVAVLCEPLSSSLAAPFDDVLARLMTDKKTAEAYLPDLIVYVGGTLVSKRLRRFLRMAKDAECICMNGDGQLHDTFMNLTTCIEGSPETLLTRMADGCNVADTSYADMWNSELSNQSSLTIYSEPKYSSDAVVKYFEEQLEDIDYDYHTHYSNSTACRLACRYAAHHVWCNRGVNGIEGCLSTAVGYAAGTDDKVFCVIGDLAFFYDQNALWNQNLSGNLRIILLNDGHGAIFDTLKGLSASPVHDSYVSGRHHSAARGICEQNDVGYLSARNDDEMHTQIVRLLTEETHRPIVLEIFL